MALRIQKDVAVLAGGAAIVPGTWTDPLSASGDWNSWTEKAVYRPTGTMTNAPFSGTDYRVSVSGGDSGNPLLQFAVGVGKFASRQRTGSTWGEWDSIEGGVPLFVDGGNAMRRHEQNVLTLERELVGRPLNVTSGSATLITGQTAYGYARAAGRGGHLAGGSIVRADGGDISGVSGALIALWSQGNRSHIRVEAGTELLGNLIVGDTSYVLHLEGQNADATRIDTWDNANYDAYEVDSSETNRDPLAFTSTSKTVSNVQIRYADGSLFWSSEGDVERAFDYFGMRRWLGTVGAESELASTAVNFRQLDRIVEKQQTEASTIWTFFHHPIIAPGSLSGATLQRITIPPSQTRFQLIKGDRRIWKGGEEVGVFDSSRTGESLTDQLERETFRHFGIPSDVKDGVVGLYFKYAVGPPATSDLAVIMDINTRRLTTASPVTAEVTINSGDEALVVYRSASQSGDIDDINTIDSQASGSDANRYRVFGDNADLTAFRTALLAQRARADSRVAQFHWIDIFGNIQQADIASIGAVQGPTSDAANRLLSYVDLGFSEVRSARPADGSAVFVAVPRPSAAHPDADPLEVREPLTWTESLGPTAGPELTSRVQSPSQGGTRLTFSLRGAGNASRRATISVADFLWLAHSGTNGGRPARYAVDTTVNDVTGEVDIDVTGGVTLPTASGIWQVFEDQGASDTRIVAPGDETDFIPSPESAEEIVLTMVGSSDLLDTAHVQYQYADGNWYWLPSDRATDATDDPDTSVKVAANQSVQFRFDVGSFIAASGDLRLRLVNRKSGETNPTFFGSVQFTANFRVSPEREAVQLVHDFPSGYGNVASGGPRQELTVARATTVTSSNVTNFRLGGQFYGLPRPVLWESFRRFNLIWRPGRYAPPDTNTFTEAEYRMTLSRLDLEHTGFGLPVLTTSATANLSPSWGWWHNLESGHQGPVANPSWRFLNNRNAGDGAFLISFVRHGAYLTGYRVWAIPFALYNVKMQVEIQP